MDESKYKNRTKILDFLRGSSDEYATPKGKQKRGISPKNIVQKGKKQMRDHKKRAKVILPVECDEGETLVKLIWACFEKQLEDGKPHACSAVIQNIGRELDIVQVEGVWLLQAIKPLVAGSENHYEIRNNHFVRIDADTMRFRFLEQISEKLTGMKKQMYDLQAQMTELYEYGERVGMKYESESLPVYKQSWDRMDACVEDVCTWMDCVEKYTDECLKKMMVG